MTNSIPRPWLVGHPEPAESKAGEGIARSELLAFRSWLDSECDDLADMIVAAPGGHLDIRNLHALMAKICDGTYVPKERA